MEQILERISNIFSSDRENNKVISLIFYLLFTGILIVGYLLASKLYLSFGFFLNPGVAARAVKVLPLLIAIVITCIYFIPDKIKELTYLYWYLFILLSAVPILIVYIFNGIADNKNVLIYIYVVELLSILGVYLISKSTFKLPEIRLSKKLFWVFIICFTCIGYGYLFLKLGAPKNIKLAFTDVYSVRLSYRELGGRFVDYFVQWLGNIINPFLLTYAIYKKKYKLVPLPLFLELILYIYTAYKSLFATLILAPFFGLVLNKGINRGFIEKSVTGVALMGVIAGFLARYSIYLSIILRIFLWPSLIALQYYDFFWMYPKVKLAHSILGGFFKNVYGMEPSFYLGSIYYGKPDMRLNVTWYGDAYMNFGILGILAFALLLYFILFIIKSVERKNICLVSSLLFGGIMALFNGPLLTTLLTNGLGIGLMLAYLLPEEI